VNLPVAAEEKHSLTNLRIGLATSSSSSIISAEDAGWAK
jgi:hypothetical protein